MTTITKTPRRIGDLLVDRGYLSDELLKAALAQQKSGGRNKLLGEILVELEYCTEDQIVECLADEYGVPYAKLEARLYDPKVVDILPREYIENNLVLPLFVVRKILAVAVSEPSNLFLIDEIKSLTGLEVQIVAATPKDIRRLLTNLPNSKVFVIDDIIEDSESADVTLIEDAIEDIGDIEEIAGQSPVIRLVNYIIFNAVREGATHVVDLATLTGAIIVALGEVYAGLFGSDDAWTEEVRAAAEASGDLAWQMPMHPDYDPLIRSRVADLANAAKKRQAGPVYAAQFLTEFTDGVPFCHVDIAGTGMVDGAGTGFGVRLIRSLGEGMAAAPR